MVVRKQWLLFRHYFLNERKVVNIFDVEFAYFVRYYVPILNIIFYLTITIDWIEYVT